MSSRHYETIARWLKEVGLLVLASLVVQKIFLGAPLSDPVVGIGLAVSLMFYGSAFGFLLKS